MANDEVVLKQYLSKYKHRDFTCREVIGLIQVYRSLAYRLEAFVFNSGARKDLLNLEGTIPVNYKGAYYNIPVKIWLMDTHPANAPLCFVKPTADMSIKVSKYVDSNGKVYLPYLHEWTQKGSTLQKLIMCMITAFGELPPVYSNPRNDTRPNYPVFMPVPSGAYPNFSQVTPQQGYQGPPYPTSSNIPYPNFGAPYPGAANTNSGLPYPPTSTPYPPQAGYSPAPDVAGGTITEEHIKASLLSAVEDKLRRRLKEQSQQSEAELDTLRRTQQELRDGKTRLEDILGRLQRERQS